MISWPIFWPAHDFRKKIMTEWDSQDPSPTELKVDITLSDRLPKKKVDATPEETSSTLGPTDMGVVSVS